MVTRINGFQYPYSSYQISISIIYICILLFFNFSILYNTIYINISYIILYINIILFICIIIVWIYIELIDPGKADPNITTKTRYCQTCRKRIAGLDHHCIWLNTCIGTVNIKLFLLLICLLFLQESIQICYIFILFFNEYEIIL